MGFLTRDEIAELMPAEMLPHTTPVPTQIVSSDEYYPPAQSEQQREVEARLIAMSDEFGQKQRLSRRQFFQSAAGMAAAFVAMNETYGLIFDASRAEAATPELAEERARALKEQFIMDMHTHFLRDDTRIQTFVRQREAVGQAGWNPALVGKPQTIEDLKYNNYFKEVFLDSDTKVALISSAPSDIPQDWFLTNEMTIAAREKVNTEAGSKRMYAHAIFTPGQPGWLESLDRALSMKPDSVKGYTIGDNTNKDISKYPWRMDDEKVAYLAYEKCLKAGIKNICVHKGLFPASIEQRFPHLLAYSDVRDVGKAAKDWPQLNFVIYHSGYRHAGGGTAADGWTEFEKTGRVSWVSDLAEIPEKFGVTNVYGDVGQLFAQSVVAEPRLGAALMGILGKGLGYDHICWGTDAIWTGSPQWQIEALRRLEIPDDMQKRYGFKPLDAAGGRVKTAIFSGNNMRLYGLQKRADLGDRFTAMKAEYERLGPARSNLRYGYVRPRADTTAA
ncbi:MAG TPA: amidohydrolase family protein [Hyphomicrobiaceae bacterium]|nr:amidohydrolase family protein [Hyphomicrobiaceae bacterium]